MSKKRYVMAIGSGIEQSNSIKVASDLGLSVVAVDGDPNAEGFKYAEIHYSTDIRDKDAVLSIAKDYNIEAVIPSCIGRYITTIGYVNENMELTGPHSFAVDYCADKKAFHDLLLFNNFHSTRQLCCRGGEASSNDLKFPIIAKPRYGSGSKYVKVIKHLTELKNFVEQYEGEKSLGELLVEEVINGVEYGVDLIACDGEILFFNLRDKVMTPLPYRQEIQYISPSFADEKIWEEIRHTMAALIKVLKITNTMMHADVIYNDGKAYLIDVSPRPAGLNILTKILKYNTGRDLISEWIKYQVWKEHLKPVEISNIVCLQYLPFEDISITYDIETNNLKEKYNIIEIEHYMHKGDNLEQIRNGADLGKRGYFIIQGNNYEEVRRRAADITNDIMTEITNG